MQVAIVHNAISQESRADESDVLIQVEQVRSALTELGHSSQPIPVDLNLQACIQQLRASGSNLVFNLIESLNGSDQQVSFAVGVLESLGLPVTGSSAEVLWVTNQKLWTKERLRLVKLPTPQWLDPDSGSRTEKNSLEIRPGDRFILKPIGEHASLGMDEGCIVEPRDVEGLAKDARAHGEKIGRPCFAEQYIFGREFNVSLLADGDSCQVLPIAEIDFSAFPAGRPRIVDYKAKWDPTSFEFQNTPRRFIEAEAEPALYSRLAALARDCWSVFRLGGYVRVDFRVDGDGQPWILEINTNPCLSPDAGFAAALRQAGIEFRQAVQRILDDALRVRQPKISHPEASLARPPVKTNRIEAKASAGLAWRFEVTVRDGSAIRELVAKTGFFYPDEVDVAVELVEERIAKGASSGYHFVLAELEGVVAGYACYGPIACTRNSYDLYWIAVDPRFQGQGIGRHVLAETERCIREAGGRRVYIETSNREQYRATRGFYLRCGYECAATLEEFYGPGDDKVIYVKSVG